ncbi:MAG: hypothetical protein ACTHJL_01940 [Amnibacterium sp.]
MASGRGRRSAVVRSAVAVLLGLPPRRPAGDRPRRSAAVSSYEAPVPAADGLQLGRAYWLPPFGRGNGLDALFWAPIARIEESRLDVVLAALRDADIPAWASPVKGDGDAHPHDLSVAAAQLDAAQDVLMRALG